MSAEGLIKTIVSLTLRTGYLDGVLAGIAETSQKMSNSLQHGVDSMEVIWRYEQSQGRYRGITFEKFVKVYLNRVVAESLENDPIDMTTVISAVAGLLSSMEGTTGKFWSKALKDMPGFSKGKLGGNLGAFGQVVFNQAKPVVLRIAAKVREDFTAAAAWDNLQEGNSRA